MAKQFFNNPKVQDGLATVLSELVPSESLPSVLRLPPSTAPVCWSPSVEHKLNPSSLQLDAVLLQVGFVVLTILGVWYALWRSLQLGN